MQIIQKNGTMKFYFVMNIMRSLTYVNIKYDLPLSEKMGHWFIFQKTNFEKAKESNHFKAKNPPFLNNPPL